MAAKKHKGILQNFDQSIVAPAELSSLPSYSYGYLFPTIGAAGLEPGRVLAATFFFLEDGEEYPYVTGVSSFPVNDAGFIEFKCPYDFVTQNSHEPGTLRAIIREDNGQYFGPPIVTDQGPVDWSIKVP